MKTTYKIDNGVISPILDEKETVELDKKQYYRLENAEVRVYDFDKHKIRPYVKDYLNRQ